MKLNTGLYDHDETLVERWEPILEGIESDYTRRVTAQLLENQAQALMSSENSMISEDLSPGATTTGQLGTFAKFAMPLVRRVYPNLILNHIAAIQPMQGPVSQIFYVGNSRSQGLSNNQTVYSKFNLTYRNLTAGAIDSASGIAGLAGLAGSVAASAGFDTSNLFGRNNSAAVGGAGAPSGTMGGQIAAFPNASAIYGFSLSAGERLTGTGIPEMTFHIEQEAVVSNTRKMRALWTLEATQDLKAYHNIDLEQELTNMLSKELSLEVDREGIEDIRMLGYGLSGTVGGADLGVMDDDYINLTGPTGVKDADNTELFVPGQFTYDFNGASANGKALGVNKLTSNVFVHDFANTTGLGMAPRHLGEVYANLLALINLVSQDIFASTHRGPGNWILTSPLVASMLESASKLEGGIAPADGPTNMSKTGIESRGKFMGRYDLYVDPLYPTDEILMGYKGDTAMESGYVHCPYIPIQNLPTIVDPETFQPRKGIMTRYGKALVQPAQRMYRVIRLVGADANFLLSPFGRNDGVQGQATQLP
jgi:hypothetical protein